MFKTKSFAIATVVLAGVSVASPQDKVWKHGILEAKSDAGFIAMVDKGGFAAKHGLKLEVVQIKAGSTLMKALISGEIDSVERGFGGQPQRPNHRHRPSCNRVVIFVAVKLKQIEIERLKPLFYIGRVRIDEDADHLRSPADHRRNRRSRRQ